MGRISKYGNSSNKGEQTFKRWSAALYIRLSREDGDKLESESVISQKAILQDFLCKQEDIDVYETYIDDGWSGTNFNRPQFIKMMDDINNHKINCVIVKDLSRFGRNYIDSGLYLEKIFPSLGLRFISINDFIDNVKQPNSMNNLVVAFKNVINDEYCRDISNKIRSALTSRRKQGKFIGSFATYGYLKDPYDHNKLIVDEEISNVIVDIFDWYINGMSIIGITKRLNEIGILNPSSYKVSKGFNYKHPSRAKNDTLWTDSSVRRILKNRMYTGVMVQGKNTVVSYKIDICKPIKEEDWICVADTHEAIISQEKFEKVQSLMLRDSRTSVKSNTVSLFSGFIKCADCLRAMNKKVNRHSYGEYTYYVCSTFKKTNNGECTKHTIRLDRLEEAVLKTIQLQIDLAVTMDDLLEKIKSKSTINNELAHYEKLITQKLAEKNKIQNIMLDLYPDWKNGDITKEEYVRLKNKFEKQLLDIDVSISKIEESVKNCNNDVMNSNEFIQNFIKHKNITSLTRDVLIELVENIYVHEGGSITIKFKFNDSYKNAIEFIRNNGGAVPNNSKNNTLIA